MTDTPEPKPVPMADLRTKLDVIARQISPGEERRHLYVLSAALDELERLRTLDAPALSEALKVAAEDLAREREGAGVLRAALEALGDPHGHITGCPARLDGSCAGECRAVRLALSSDAGKAALEERRALEARGAELVALLDLYAKNANELSAQHRVDRDALKAEANRLRGALMEIDRKQRDTIPADYRYDNNDIGKVKMDRDRLRTARYWIAGRIEAALYSDAGRAALEERRALEAKVEQLDALQKFKAYVHQRLDEAGIPTHPDGPHSKEGCRVGDRLDIALSDASEHQATLAREFERSTRREAKGPRCRHDVDTVSRCILDAGHSLLSGTPSDHDFGSASEEEVDALKAEVERLTREVDCARKAFLTERRMFEEHAAKDWKTALEGMAIEAEVKRLREALLNYLQAGHKEARERAAQQAKAALGIPPEHSGREPQYALAPSQPAPVAEPSTAKMTCGYCGVVGHITGTCPKYAADDAKGRAPASPVVGGGAGPLAAALETPEAIAEIARVGWAADNARRAPSPAGEGEGPKMLLTICAECGPNVQVDEDGCCAGCGGSALLSPATSDALAAWRDAAVAKAVAEAWERAAQIVEGPMVPGSRVPTVEERGLAAIFRNRARSTSPAGGAP